MFEDCNGLVRTIVVFVLMVVVVVLGLRWLWDVGWLFVTFGVLLLALSSFGGYLVLGSLFAAVTPALIVGALYLVAAHLDPGPAAPAAPVRPDDRLGVG